MRMIPRLTLRADDARPAPVITADVEAGIGLADLITVNVGDVLTITLDVDTADALADALVGALARVDDPPAVTGGYRPVVDGPDVWQG